MHISETLLKNFSMNKICVSQKCIYLFIWQKIYFFYLTTSKNAHYGSPCFGNLCYKYLFEICIRNLRSRIMTNRNWLNNRKIYHEVGAKRTNGVSNLKSYLPAVISSRNYHPPSRNYRIIPHGKNDNSQDPAGSRCRNCQDTSRNSRGSEGILISSIQGRKQHLLHFPFHSFVLLFRYGFFPLPYHLSGVQRTSSCIVHARVYVPRRYISTGSRISPFLSLP